MYGLYFWPEMGQMDADDQRFQRAIVGAFCRFFETAGAEVGTF
jgi:hypothetical protein